MPLTDTPPDTVLKSLHDLRPSPLPDQNGHATGNGHAPHAEVTPSSPRLSLAGDIGADGQFGERWLIVDSDTLRVISVGELGEATVDLDLSLSEIAEARVESLVGSSVLLLVLKNGRRVEALRYTVAHAQEFGVAARAIEAFLKGEELPDSIAAELDKKVCPKCGDPLTEDNSICVKCIDKRAVLLRLMKYAIPYKARIAVVSFLMIMSIVFLVVTPVFQQKLVDNVLVPHKHYGWILLIVLARFLVDLIALLFAVLRGRVAAWISNHMIYLLRTQAYAKLQQLSLSYFDKRQTGSLLNRVTQDVNELQTFIVDGIQYFLVNALTILGILIIMLHYNWQLTLLVLMPLPLTVWMVRNIFKLLWGRLHRMYYMRSNLTAIISSVLSGVRVVKAFAQETRETDRFSEKAFGLFKAGVVVEQSWATFFPVIAFVTQIGIYIIWLVGGWKVFANTTNQAEHGMTLGVLMMFITYSGMILAPLQGMTRIAEWLSRSVASAERVFEVLDSNPEIQNVSNPVRMPIIDGRVELRNVRFSYDHHHNVLDDISIMVEPGEMIGLVGHSGAGKSTIINLLSRFYDVREGAILIDGVDIRQIDMYDLRHQIGVVLQEPFLFPGTIADNIGYARPDAKPEDIMQAAKAANAHDFIMRFPDGYDTFVGERGARLSGGERQRLSIARAILHDPRILILDEATSSVDTETEKQIQEAITRLIQGRTTFAIAHRLSTLRNADRLMVIERGKLVELGTHADLMEKPEGVFRKLVDMQNEINQLQADQLHGV